MADGGWKDVDRKGQPSKKDGNTIKNIEKALRNEGKLHYIRLERIVRDCEQQFDVSTATLDTMKSIINNKKGVSLISLDGTEKIDKLKHFTTKITDGFIASSQTSLTNATKYAVLFKVMTKGESFCELKNDNETFSIISKWNIRMIKHQLSDDETDVKLAFNVLMLNPYLMNREEHAKLMDEEIKEFVKHKVAADPAYVNKIGAGFYKWIKSTDTKTVEIGVRKLMAAHTDPLSGETVIVETLVPTISVEASKYKVMKDIIKAKVWDERQFGKFIDENPTTTSKHIQDLYRHNGFFRRCAYVRVNWLPENVFTHAWDNVPGFSNTLLKKTTLDSNNNTVPLIRSIHKIRSSTGMYFMITTKELLEEAQQFVLKLANEINASGRFLNNQEKSFNPENNPIAVIQKRNSVAGSEISDTTKDQKVNKIAIDVNDLAYNKDNRTVQASRTKEQTISTKDSCKNKVKVDKGTPTDKTKIKKTYAEIAKSIGNKEAGSSIENVMIEVSKDKSCKNKNNNESIDSSLDIEEQIVAINSGNVASPKEFTIMRLIAEFNKLKEKQEKEINDIKKNQLLMEQHYEKRKNKDREKLKQLQAENALLRQQIQMKSDNTVAELHPESPMPVHCSKKLKDLVYAKTSRIPFLV